MLYVCSFCELLSLFCFLEQCICQVLRITGDIFLSWEDLIGLVMSEHLKVLEFKGLRTVNDEGLLHLLQDDSNPFRGETPYITCLGLSEDIFWFSITCKYLCITRLYFITRLSLPHIFFCYPSIYTSISIFFSLNRRSVEAFALIRLYSLEAVQLPLFELEGPGSGTRHHRGFLRVLHITLHTLYISSLHISLSLETSACMERDRRL